MVSLIYQHSGQAAGAGARDTPVLCPAAPFLRVPTIYPDVIRVNIDITKHPRFASYSFSKEPEQDDELTQIAQDTAHGESKPFFDLTVRVAHTKDGGIYAFIDPHYSGVTTFAVGGRVSLIDRHYENAGAFLLWLIEKCPLHVWNPDTVQEFAAKPYAGNYDWGEHHSLTVWDLPEGTWDGVPKLPPNLTRIVRECLAAHEKWEDNFQEYQDVQLFPIGMAVWNNVVPWQNKMTKRQRCFGPERGNDLSWLALDDLGMYHMETGLHSTCTELIHSVQRLTEIMELTAPFIKLYKYLSHATGEISYNYSF
jgi:hypothetical protein